MPRNLNIVSWDVLKKRSIFEYNLRKLVKVLYPESQILRDQVDRLQNDLDSAQARYTQSCSKENTVLDQLETETIVGLRTQLYDLRSQLEALEAVKDDLNEHVTRMGAENFELTQRLEQVQNMNNDLLNLRAMVNNYEEMLNNQKEKYECNATEVRNKYQSQVAQLNIELENLKLCLDDKDKLLRRSDEERERMRLQIEGSSVWITKEKAEQAESSVVLVENTSLGTPNTEDIFASLTRLELENSNLRSELDHARLSLAETREVQREVEWLKGELDEERRQGEAKWAEVCEKLVKAETTENGDSPGRSISRKASIEEMHCYLDAYAEKCRRLEGELMNAHARLRFQNLQDATAPFESTSIIQSLNEPMDRVQELEKEVKQRRDEIERSAQKMRQLEDELQKSKERIESDKLEKRKLKQAVKQLRDKTQEKEADDVVEEVVNNIDMASIPSPNMKIEELQNKLQLAMMEARISTELNVEMSRAMEELEEKISQMKIEKEEEKKKFENLSDQYNQMSAEFIEQSGGVEHLNSKVAALVADLESLKNQLDKQTEEFQKKENEVQRLEEAGIRREKEHREVQSAHDDEVHSLSIVNEDLRRILSDMEVKMELKEQRMNELSQRLLSSQTYVENLSLQHSKTENVVGVEKLQQHESLLHATVNTTQTITIPRRETECQDYQQNCREFSQQAHALNSQQGTSEPHHDPRLFPCSLSHEQTSHFEYDFQHSRQTGRSSQVCQKEYIMETPILSRSSEDLQNRNDATPSKFQINDDSVATCIQDHACLLIDQPLSSVTLAEEVPDLKEQLSTSVREHIETMHADSDLFAENQLLRECVNETSRMQDDLGNDVERLMTLKEDLEILVDALKGEIWALNGQLKASVFDRENLSDRVATLDSQLDAEKRRADQLDQDLSEQVELTEKSQRQAAESENESNRRLAECLEMEQRREELEKAYTQLTDYYTQLQSAYSILYEKMGFEQVNSETQTTSNDIHQGQEAMILRTLCCKQLSVARDQVNRLRDKLVHLTKDVLGYELATVETQMTASLEIITEMIGYVDSAELTSITSAEGLFLNSYLNQILAECNIEIDASISGLRSKIRYVHEHLLVKRGEVECSRTAIAEQRRVCSALEERLREIESIDNREAVQTTQRRLAETQTLLEIRTHECDQLQLRVEELQNAIADLSTANDEREAARLATRQADVDALFRANAELAHTNVALQNEIDEREDDTNIPNTSGLENKWNEAELARLREVELLLNAKVSSLSVQMEKAEEQIMELQEKLDMAEQNVLKAATDVEWGWETANSNEQTVEECINDRVRVLEGEVETLQAQLTEKRKAEEKDHSDQEEIFRLRSVEELLRKTISGFEDKLMEAEVRIGELEDTLYEERQQSNVREDQKGSSSVELIAIAPSSAVRTSYDGRQEDEDACGMGNTEIQADEMSLLRSMSASLNETISRLRIELEESRARIVTLEGNAQTKAKEVEDGWAAWSDEISCTDTLGVKAEELEKARQTETQLREKLKNQLDEMEKLENVYGEEMHDMKKVETELRKRVKELEQQASEREDQIYKQSTSNAVDGWSSNWEEKSDAQADEIEQLNKQLEESTSRVAELVTDLSKIQSAHDCQINDLRREVDELQNCLQVAETKCNERGRDIQNLQLSTTSVVEKMNDWGESWEEDNTQYEEDEEVQRERERRMKADTQKRHLEDVVRQLTLQVFELQEKLSEADCTVVELKQAREECAVLRVQIEEMRVRFDEIETQKEQVLWGWGEEDKEKFTEDCQELIDLRIRVSVLENELQTALIRIDEMQREIVEIVESKEQSLKEAEKIQISLQKEVTTLLTRVVEEKNENGRLEEKQREKESHYQKELASMCEELEKYRLQLSDAEQRLHDTEKLENQIVDLRERLEKTLKQNDLLKESEGKLLESVDDYGEQLELSQKEAGRLQLVVNDLERQLTEIDELRDKLMEVETQRDKLQAKKNSQQNDNASDQLIQLQEEIDWLKGTIQEKENLLQQVLVEKQSLSQRLQSVEKTLGTVEQERDTVKRSLEELRSKLTARRRATGVMREASCSSSVVSTKDHDIPEEPRSSVSPQSMYGFGSSTGLTASSQGVATQDGFRRRGASRKNE